MNSMRTHADSRFAQLAQQSELVFHARDLGNLWDITDRNTLYTTLKRYVQRGLLYRIHKGLYSLIAPDHINPALLGIKAVHAYAYVSTETVLAGAGVIFQSVPAITLVSSESLRFTIGDHTYRVRQLADRYLYNAIGVEQRDGVYYATPERAVADMLYFNSRAYFDNPDAVNWNAVRETQRTIGYSINAPS